MKKLISLLIISLIITCALPCVFAQNNIIYAGTYCDFYVLDNGLPKTGAGQKSVLLSGGEWIKFGIKEKGLSEGSYTLSLRQANVRENSANKKDIVFIDILSDDKMVLKKELNFSFIKEYL